MADQAAPDTSAEQLSEIEFLKKVRESVPPLEEGQSYFLLPYDWYVAWLEHLEGRNQMRPAGVPVETLLDEAGELREGLLQNADYALVHSSVWTELKRLYSSTKEIERKVIPNPADDFDHIIEVYQFGLRVVFNEKGIDKVMKFSKSLTISQLKKKLAETFQVDEKNLDTRFLTKDSETLIPEITSNTLIGNSRLIEEDIVFVKLSSDPVSSPHPTSNHLPQNESNKVRPFRSTTKETSDESGDENDENASESARAHCGSLSRSDISEVDEIMDDATEENQQGQYMAQRTIHKYQPFDQVDEDGIEEFENDPSGSNSESKRKDVVNVGAKHEPHSQAATRIRIDEKDGDDGDDEDYENTVEHKRVADDPRETGNITSPLHAVEKPKIRFAKDAGLVGLSNLGNTCFMNSALQCLSNTPELRDYFMTDRFKSEINVTNVLGTRGALATEFASLIREMWSGRSRVVTPRDFKYVLGRHAPRVRFILLFFLCVCFSIIKL